MPVDSYYTYDRDEVTPFVPRNARSVLDVGCAAGRFGAVLKQRLGAEVWGIEYLPDVASEASKVLDKVLVGDCLDQLRSLDRLFDCVTALDVLEHTVDPGAVLREMGAAMNPGGALLLSVPNVLFVKVLFAMLLKKDFPYESWGVLDRTHLRFFTRKSIVRLVEENGFTVQKAIGINSRLSRPVSALLAGLSLGMASESQYLQNLVLAYKEC